MLTLLYKHISGNSRYKKYELQLHFFKRRLQKCGYRVADKKYKLVDCAKNASVFFIWWLTKNGAAYENDLSTVNVFFFFFFLMGSTVNVRETQRETKRAIVREIALTFQF